MEPITNTGLTEEAWPRIVISKIEGFSNILKLRQTIGLYVDQVVWLRKDGISSKKFRIFRILDARHVMLRDIEDLGIELDLSIFTGGVLDAPEQSRVLAADVTIQRTAYMEEPLMAFRTIDVSSDGSTLTSARGQINIEDPELNLVYDNCYNVTALREFAFDKEKEYEEDVLSIASRNLIVLSTSYPFWFQIDEKFLYYERQGDGSIDNATAMTIVDINRYESGHIYTSTNALDFNGNQITTTDPGLYPTWMTSGKYIKINGGLNDGTIVKILSTSPGIVTVDVTLVADLIVATLDGTVRVIEVSDTPPTDGLIAATFDGNLGDQLKSTNLVYGDAVQVEKIYTSQEEVTVDDILTPNRQ